MVHQYKLNGYNIVIDVCSGGIHVVDDIAYDIIALFENCDKQEVISIVYNKYNKEVSLEEVEECYLQVVELKDSGTLFSKDNFESQAGKLKAKSNGIVKALCLHVAHTCNLNCSYCFASQGKYHGDRAIMSLEVGKRALDFLVEPEDFYRFTYKKIYEGTAGDYNYEK